MPRLGGTDAVLAHLLGEHDVARRWPGCSSRPYLISPSNSPTAPSCGPAEVGAPDEVADRVRTSTAAPAGQTRSHDRDPAARLADALARPARRRRPRAAPPGRRATAMTRSSASPARGAVHESLRPGAASSHDDRLLERRDGAGDVDDACAPTDVTATPSTTHDLVGMQRRGVHVDDPSPPAARMAACTRHVHPVQRRPPTAAGRAATRSRDVADHGFVSQRAELPP